MTQTTAIMDEMKYDILSQLCLCLGVCKKEIERKEFFFFFFLLYHLPFISSLNRNKSYILFLP